MATGHRQTANSPIRKVANLPRRHPANFFREWIVTKFSGQDQLLASHSKVGAVEDILRQKTFMTNVYPVEGGRFGDSATRIS